MFRTRLAILLLSGWTIWAQSPDERRVQELIENARQQKTPEGWARGLMAADLEAAKLERREPAPCCDVRCVRIPGFDLHYRWSEIGHSEEHQHDLLRRVVSAQAGTPWGADALVELLRLGPSGPWFDDEFVPWPLHERIIRLIDSRNWRKLNDSRLIRIAAEAYETWWSLSLAPADDPMLQDAAVNAASFAPGADRARRNAMRLYETVLSAEQDSGLRRRVNMLRNRQDTHQRAWFRGGD